MGGTKWQNFKNNNLLTPANDVIPMLRSEARSLEKKTGGKVKATFSKIEYGRNGITQMLDTASTISRAMSSYGNEIDENANKIDANDLFIRQDYKFEIYSQSYRFRVFTLHYNEFYPLGMTLNENLLKDTGFSRSDIEIESRNALDEVIENLFCCKRLTAHQGTEWAVAAVDIQHFKLYNELYGTEKGDVLLETMANCLLGYSKQTGYPVGYFGNDDFFLCLPD